MGRLLREETLLNSRLLGMGSLLTESCCFDGILYNFTVGVTATDNYWFQFKITSIDAASDTLEEEVRSLSRILTVIESCRYPSWCSSPSTLQNVTPNKTLRVPSAYRLLSIVVSLSLTTKVNMNASSNDLIYKPLKSIERDQLPKLWGTGVLVQM